MRLPRVSLAALVLALPALGAEPASPIPALEPFAPLVGTVWVGTFPDGKTTDTQEFAWVYGGKFLRNVHRVRNAAGEVVYEGETIYAWDPKSETIVWWYWNATGGFITGTLVKSDDGWRVDGLNHAPPPQPERVRGSLRIRSKREWESVQYLPEGDGWKERFTMTFRPKEAAAGSS